MMCQAHWLHAKVFLCEYYLQYLIQIRTSTFIRDLHTFCRSKRLYWGCSACGGMRLSLWATSKASCNCRTVHSEVPLQQCLSCLWPFFLFTSVLIRCFLRHSRGEYQYASSVHAFFPVKPLSIVSCWAYDELQASQRLTPEQTSERWLLVSECFWMTINSY